MAIHISTAQIALGVSTISLCLSGYAVFIKRPKIVIEDAYLMRNHFPDDWKDKTAAELSSAFMDFAVEIMIANYMAESGSISKPILRISAAGKSIIVKPTTQHTESERVDDNPNVIRSWSIRHGKSYMVGPYGREDDRLEYEIDNRPQDIEFLVKNYDDLKYELEYMNHKGKLVRYALTKKFDEND